MQEKAKEIRNEIKPEEFFIYYQQPQGQEFYRKIEKITLSKIRDKFDTNFRKKFL